MKKATSRRTFLASAAKASAIAATYGVAGIPKPGAAPTFEQKTAGSFHGNRIVDLHMHFDPKNPGFFDDFLKVSDSLNLTGCILTPFEHRKVVAEVAKKYPRQVIPFGYVDLDAPDVARQVQELHELGYRGLGELEFVKKPFHGLSYFPVYDLANRYNWIVLFHTGIVLREKFNEPEDVASHRMRPLYLEEIARRFPQITVVGAHCGNPEYEWAAEIARWNPNIFFDLSGSTLKKFSGRLGEFSRYFWWTDTDEGTDTPDNNPSAFTKLVFGTDTSPRNVQQVLTQYRALFEACNVPESARQLILGGTLAKILRLPD